jgi:hypothetical protein
MSGNLICVYFFAVFSYLFLEYHTLLLANRGLLALQLWVFSSIQQRARGLMV